MDITWYGQNCFRITERGQTTIVTDPYPATLGLPPLKLKADVITLSQREHVTEDDLEGVKGFTYALEGPGEYEFGGTFIWGLPMHDMREDQFRRNVGYMVQYDSGLTVLHAGHLTTVPDQSVIQDLGEINVLLLPVGGHGTLRSAEAAEVVALIEPNYVVPMAYAIPGLKMDLEPVDRFLKTMGVSKAIEEDVLRINAGEHPEQTQVIILRPQS